MSTHQPPTVGRLFILAAVTGILASQPTQAEDQLWVPRGAAVDTVQAGTSLANPQPDEFGGVVSTHILVKLRADAQERLLRANQDALVLSDPRNQLGEQFRAIAATWQVASMTPLCVEPFADPALAARLGLDRTYVTDVPRGTDTEAMAASFAAIGEVVEAAGFDSIGGVAGGDMAESGVALSQVFPDDVEFSLQWGMHNTGQTIQGQAGTPDADIDAPEAWAIHTGNFGTVTVAEISTGFNSHPEYGNNAAPFPNGRVLHGYNTVLDSDAPADLVEDTCSFGARMAGTIAAAGNNGQGIAGVTWGAYLMPVKVLTGCNGNVTDLIEGIVWAADHGAHVISMGLQYNITSPATADALQSAVDYAHDRGVLLIAAVGGSGICGGAVCYPARADHVIGVSSTRSDDQFDSSLSNHGPEVDVCAPGKNIRTTSSSSGYVFQNGTGIASAHVSGLAALIKSYAPFRTNDEIAEIIQGTADDLDPMGWDDHFGYGRVNAAHSLIAAFPCADADDCNDGSPCTDDACLSGMCRFTNNTAACDDSLFCTVGEACFHGNCGGAPRDCSDGLLCTQGVCDETLDLCAQIPNDALCDDGMFCNGKERCDALSGCQPAARVPCAVNQCDELLDRCRFRADPLLRLPSGRR